MNSDYDSPNFSSNEIALLKVLGDSVATTLGGKQDLLARMAENKGWDHDARKPLRTDADDPVGMGEYRATLASKLDLLSESGWDADDAELVFPEDGHFQERYLIAEAHLIAAGWLYMEDGDLLFGTRRMWEWYMDGLRTGEKTDDCGAVHETSPSEPAQKRYNILPPLLPDEFEALKASIAERGVDVPIIVDQDGNVIDGYHRQRACDELGIFCPREVRHFDSETDKLELALSLNCGRRQLNRKQKRSVIDAYLLRDPQIADNFLAQIIGVSKNTVADVRSTLEATCQIDKFDELRGKDGRLRPVRYKKIIANTPKEAEAALRLIGDLPENCAGKTIDSETAARQAGFDSLSGNLRTFTQLQSDYTEAVHEPDSEYSTPDWLFQLLDDEFHFTLDAAASKENAKCPRFFTSEDDGLINDWKGETVWLNPPFHRKLIENWVRKAFEESQRGTTVVMLIPSMFKDYRWWKECCVQGEVRFLHEYVRFHRSDDAAKTAYKDVTVVIFGPEVVPGTVAPLQPTEGTADGRKRAEERDPHDFYPTPRGVIEALLQVEQFSESVWEPACGDGAISNVLAEAGYSVDSSDLIDRGYGDVEDFITTERRTTNIITNPPFGKAEEFVRTALSCTTGKVAMFLPLTFLESQKRESLLAGSCLKTVYVFVDRVSLYKGGSDNRGGGRAAYAWFVWEHGYAGPPTLGWVHSERKGVILEPLVDRDGTAPITLDLSVSELPRGHEPELIKELCIHIEDAYDLERPMNAGALLGEWAGWEGVPVEAAVRLVPFLPDEVRRLLISDLPPAA